MAKNIKQVLFTAPQGFLKFENPPLKSESFKFSLRVKTAAKNKTRQNSIKRYLRECLIVYRISGQFIICAKIKKPINFLTFENVTKTGS